MDISEFFNSARVKVQTSFQSCILLKEKLCSHVLLNCLPYLVVKSDPVYLSLILSLCSSTVHLITSGVHPYIFYTG